METPEEFLSECVQTGSHGEGDNSIRTTSRVGIRAPLDQLVRLVGTPGEGSLTEGDGLQEQEGEEDHLGDHIPLVGRLGRE